MQSLLIFLLLLAIVLSAIILIPPDPEFWEDFDEWNRDHGYW